jgi:hypothetical protein
MTISMLSIAGDASNVLPGSGAQFHRDETTRQAVYAQTRLAFCVLLGSSTGPVRPQWGQQSATAQAADAVIV